MLILEFGSSNELCVIGAVPNFIVSTWNISICICTLGFDRVEPLFLLWTNFLVQLLMFFFPSNELKRGIAANSCFSFSFLVF